MAFDLRITNPQLHPNVVPHRIVPVRFARAVSGFADSDAPDIDDHGFVLPQDFSTALGPVVGITKTKTIRVKVIRDRLEATTQIFPSVDDASIASLEHPPAGTALNPNDVGERLGDCIYLNGSSTATTTQETKVKLHFGSADGPVLAEMAVRVYPQLVVRVRAHIVTINGSAPTTTLADIQSIFRRVNRIYAQAGVLFILDNNLMVENVNGFATAGTMTMAGNLPFNQANELFTVLRQHPEPNRLNAYWVGHIANSSNGTVDTILGVGITNAIATGNPPNPATGFIGGQTGILMRDNNAIPMVSATTAHECGHILSLEHYGNRNGNAVIDDIWAQRALMFNFSNLSATAARNQVGYGNNPGGNIRRGQLLLTKKLAHLRQSDHINRIRRAVLNRTYVPI